MDSDRAGDCGVHLSDGHTAAQLLDLPTQEKQRAQKAPLTPSTWNDLVLTLKYWLD